MIPVIESATVRNRANPIARFPGLLLYVLLACCGLAAQQRPKVRITQVDSSRFPQVTVHVLVTDSNDDPLPGSSRINLDIFEDGKKVQGRALSQGSAVSTVLVLDHSGSMKGEKLEKAKAAALSYIENAPESYWIAVVDFSTQPHILSDFTNNRSALRDAINNLTAGGNTAMQDAIGSALDLIARRKGRRAVLVLTDGIENASKRYPGEGGRNSLLQHARDIGASVSTIGLGTDVRADDLRQFESTGGLYFYSPGPNELRKIFEKSAALLKKEQQFEFKSLHEADGRVGKLDARLAIIGPDGKRIEAHDGEVYVIPGFIPNVKGRLSPYFAGLLVLLVTPPLVSKAGSLAAIRRFRASQLQILWPASRLIGMTDPNAGPARPFQTGDPVIVCPGCSKPHHIRSWRNNLCACMHESRGKGPVCYHRVFPAWTRRLLDSLSGGRTSSTGRTWLCRCAGDDEGY